MFRNLGTERSSDLIRAAVAMTVVEWQRRYGVVPTETLTTEIKAAAVGTEVPGYCYRRAGWVRVPRKGRLIILRCPRTQIDAAVRRSDEAA